MKHSTIRFLLAAGICLLAGCATRSDMDSTMRDLEEMKGRLLTMEKEVGGVKTETREGLEKSTQGLLKEVESQRKIVADLQATLDSTKVDMQVLAGKVDDLSLAGKKPAEELSLLREDTGRRITTVEERLAKLEKGLDEFRKQAVDAAAKAQSTPDGLYQQGRDAYKTSNMAKARESFTAFLEKYPKHELAVNARYWLGETWYGDKNYEQAILEYQKVIKEFPGKEKVPAAMLKQALAFRELGDTKSARFILKKIVEEFPLSEEAGPAKVKLKELK